MRRFTKQAALMLLWGFLLGIHEGKVALWRDDQPKPEQIYDIRASCLPPADRLLLRRGLRFDDREELWMILENYLE